METRDELLLKFMLALASNSQMFLEAEKAEFTSEEAATIIFCAAHALVERYYKSLG